MCQHACCPCSQPEPHIHVFKWDGGLMRCKICGAEFWDSTAKGTDAR